MKNRSVSLIAFVCGFLSIVSVVFSSQLIPREEEKELCFEYQLENECSTLVNQVVLDKSLQEDAFDLIRLNISDIRMAPPFCRRPSLWYLCTTAFPRCPPESGEEEECRQVEGCRQVAELCHLMAEEFCPSSSTNISQNCTEKIQQEIEEATKNPIQVVTCLGEEKETIECCPDPFAVDRDGECVVECFQYGYPKGMIIFTDVISMISFWVGLGLLIFAFVPFWVLKVDMRYPHYVMLLGTTSWVMFLGSSIWSTFAGGPENYICGDEVSFFVALDKFAKNPRSAVQLFCTIFFCLFGLNCWAISGFNTMCLISRKGGLQIFVQRPVPRWLEGIMMFSALFIAFAIALSFFILFFANPDIVIIPTPYLFYPVPLLQNNHLWKFYKVSLVTPAGVVLFFFLITLIVAYRTNFRIFYYQWRPLFISFYTSLMFYFFIHLLFIAKDPYIPELSDYTICVLSHPQQDPPPCKREYLFGLFNAIDVTILVITAPLFGGVLFLTNPLVVGWWYRLVSLGEFTRSVEVLEPLSTPIQTHQTFETASH